MKKTILLGMFLVMLHIANAAITIEAPQFMTEAQTIGINFSLTPVILELVFINFWINSS